MTRLVREVHRLLRPPKAGSVSNETGEVFQKQRRYILRVIWASALITREMPSVWVRQLRSFYGV